MGGRCARTSRTTTPKRMYNVERLTHHLESLCRDYPVFTKHARNILKRRVKDLHLVDSSYFTRFVDAFVDGDTNAMNTLQGELYQQQTSAHNQLTLWKCIALHKKMDREGEERRVLPAWNQLEIEQLERDFVFLEAHRVVDVHVAGDVYRGMFEPFVRYTKKWYEDGRPYWKLPPNVQEELLAWALCYNRALYVEFPREIFTLVCEWIKTPMTVSLLGADGEMSKICYCLTEHCYVCTRPAADSRLSYHDCPTCKRGVQW